MSHATHSRFSFEIATEGDCDVVNLTASIHKYADKMRGEGLLHLYVIGSTVALTTLEFEPGLVQHDLKETLQRLIPSNIEYRHQLTWHDDNGHAHIRASLIGPMLMLPFKEGKIITGEYQQPVLIDFDTRPRRRQVIATVV